MQPGRVIHFQAAPTARSVVSPAKDPWTRPEWSKIRARHTAAWSKPGAWPSRTAKAKGKALRRLWDQIRDYGMLMEPKKGIPCVAGQGDPKAKVLLLMKSPGIREVEKPHTVTHGNSPTGRVYHKVLDGIQGSGASVWVAYVFPYHRGTYWQGVDVPEGAAGAFSFYVRATIRILGPKVVVCPSRYLAKYVRASCVPRNIDSVPDAPMSEFVDVNINRIKFHMLRIPHPYTTSVECSGIDRERRLENREHLRKGLDLLKARVTVSKRPIDATAFLMRGERRLLEGGGAGSTIGRLLPGVDEPPNFAWTREWKRLALMDTPTTKAQVARLAQKRGIQVLVNLGPRPHPKSWFRGIGCKQIHSAVPDDQGTPSLMEAYRLSTAICDALRRKQSVAIHRRYGSGASGTLLACALLVAEKASSAPNALEIVKKMRPAFQSSSIQKKFLETFERWLSDTSSDGEASSFHKPARGPSPDIGSFSSTTDDDDEPPKKKRRKSGPDLLFVVWLKDGDRHYKFVDRVFQTRDEADKFVDRGNRTLRRHDDKRNLLEARSQLLGTMKHPPVLYFLKDNDVRVHEIWDVIDDAFSYVSFGEPRCDHASSLEVRNSRRRKDSENKTITTESWNLFSRGLSYKP